MAGTSPLLTRILAVLRSMDDDALAALASPGLVRRAKRDLERSTPTWIGEDDEAVTVDVDGVPVRIPEVPARAKSADAASGLDRRAVAALLWLRDRGDADDEPAPSGVAREEIESIGDDVLVRFAGRAAFELGRRIAASTSRVEIEEGSSLVVRLPERSVEVRFFPGARLEDAVATGPSTDPPVLVVTAILAVQVNAGRRRIEIEEPSSAAAGGAPRSRDDVRRSLARALEETVVLGTARLAASAAEELRSLTVSARGVDLPRLARAIARVADEVDLHLRRDARADVGAWMAAASHAAALAEALSVETPALVGRHRARFEPVGDIELVGVGARAWRRGEWAGLTVHFWDSAAARFVTWSDARPIADGRRVAAPVRRYRESGPWTGCPSPRDAARSVLRLEKAWRSDDAKLGARAESRATLVGPTRADDLPPTIECWNALGDAARALGGGLRPSSEGDRVVLLRPASWGEARFDAATQELALPILDADGRALELRVAHVEEAPTDAVASLRRYRPERGDTLAALLDIADGDVVATPLAAIGANGVHVFGLDDVRAPRGGSRPPRTPWPGGDGADDAPDDLPRRDRHTGADPSAIARLVREAREALEAVAEVGLLASRSTDLERSAHALRCAGVETLAAPLESAAAALSDRSDPRAAARSLLRAHWAACVAAREECIARREMA